MDNSANARVPKIIIIYELLLGLFESVIGAGLFFFGKDLLNFYNQLAVTELLEDPHDLFVNLTEGLIPKLFEHHIYIAILLLAFGVVKITSGMGLLYKREWGKHLLIGLLVILIPVDSYDLIKQVSLFKIAYLLIDVVIALYLIDFKPKQYIGELRDFLKN